MRSKYLKWTSPLILASLLTSCYSYKPGYMNSPKFEKSKEVNIGGSIGSNFGAHISHNPIDRLALMAEVSSGLGIEGETEGTAYLNQNEQTVSKFGYRDIAYGFAAGTYWKYNEKLYHDFYLGYGSGRGSALTEFNFVFYPETVFDLVALEGTYSNVFAQSSFKFITGDVVDLSLNTRLNFLKYNSFKYVYYDDPNATKEQIESFFDEKNRIAAQFGLTATFNLEHFNVFTQFQLAASDSDRYDYFAVRPFSMYLGFSLPLDQFWRKEKTLND